MRKKITGKLLWKELRRPAHLGRGVGTGPEEVRASLLLPVEMAIIVRIVATAAAVCRGFFVIRKRQKWVPDALLLGRSTHPHPVQAGACFSPPILPTLRAFLFRSIHCWPSWEGLAQPARSLSLGPCCFSQLPPPACMPQSSSRSNMPGGERGGRQLSRHFRVSEFLNLFRSLALVFIHLSLKAGV